MEPVAKAVLRAYGLPVTRNVWARTWDEAAAGAEEVGGPLVAKTVSPEVVHGSDVGGMIVGVRDLDGLREAWERLPAFAGVLRDELVGGGVEPILGSKQDPSFGTVVLAGIGGTAVEVYQDVALRGLTGFPPVDGHRGAKPVDLVALAKLMVAFSEAAHDLRGEVVSVDLSPVLASADRGVVAEARRMLR